MREQEVVCIICPKGCRIRVTGEGERVDSIENNQCKRGLEYATTEFVNPCRILTTSVPLAHSRRKMLPVRSSAPIPKGLLLDCMAEIRRSCAKAPVAMHQVIVSDVMRTGVDMVATMPVGGEES